MTVAGRNQDHDTEPPPVRSARPAAAEITITLYGTEAGQSQFRYRVDPGGPFAATADPPSPARDSAYDSLSHVAEREVRTALGVFRDLRPS